jgi:hypothetical protein
LEEWIMRRFLLCGGVNGNPEALEWLRQTVDSRHPDGVLFVGGILDPARAGPGTTMPGELTRAEGQLLEQFFETVGNLNLLSAIIPGRFDAPLDEFLKLGMAAEVEFPGLHLVHALMVAQGDLAICGLGGEVSEEGTGADYSRVRAAYHLRALWDAEQSHKVLLLSSPPLGPLGGAEGNAVVGDFIDSYHPSLCVVAGPANCLGKQRIAHTLVVNPGLLTHKSAAWLDWSKPVDHQVELLNVTALEAAPVR